VEINDFAMNDV